MSTIKTKNIKQTVIGSTTQPLKIGGILEDGSDAVITIDTNGVLSGLTKSYTATIPSSSWTGTEAPFSKAVTISGILSSDEPFIDIVPTGTYATDITMQQNWGKVYRAVTSTDTITFYATAVPSADIPLKVKVIK